MPTLRGYIPPLPHTIVARQHDELAFIVNMSMSAAEELAVLEEHMKTCDTEYHRSHRRQLLETLATSSERIAELHVALDIGDN